MVKQHAIQVRAPVCYLLVGMISGLVAAKYWAAPIGWLLFGASVFGGGALALTKFPRIWAATFAFAGTLTFWAYGMIRLPRPPSEFALSMPPREAALKLEVQRVMHSNNEYGSVSGIARVIAAPKLSRLETNTPLYFRLKQDARNVQRGMEIAATGVLTPIRQPIEDSFDSYLKSIGVHYRFERSITMQTIREAPPFERFCLQMNERFQRYLRLGAPADSNVANVYSAMLLGRKVELSADQAERFRLSGTMHFFAISGLHIGVIATVIAQFLLLIRVPRPLNPLIGLPLLYLYVAITGASPSAVRAFLMAAFFWASFTFQRQRNPLAALVNSAIFVLIIQPTQLWTIGFQLSYAVVLSILLFGLPLHQWFGERLQLFRWLPKDSWTGVHHAIHWSSQTLTLLFAISFSAWLASTPLSAGLFGFITPGAVLLNMLLVNLAALVISAGVIAIAVALVLPLGLCAFINHSAWVVITVMDTIVILFSQIPATVLPCENFPMAMSYLSLGAYFTLLFWHHHERRRARAFRMLSAPAALLLIVIGGYLAP